MQNLALEGSAGDEGGPVQSIGGHNAATDGGGGGIANDAPIPRSRSRSHGSE